MLNLATILEESTRRYPNQTAIVFNDVRLSYTQLNSAANQVAQGLKNIGLERGDHVALSCLNLPYFSIVYYGILKAGGTVVPLNVLLKRQEVTYHLDDSEAKVYFCFQGTEQLPMGEEGFAGFNEAKGCEHFVMITADPAQDSSIEGTQTLGQFMKDQAPNFDMVQTQPEDTAVILYTSGTPIWGVEMKVVDAGDKELPPHESGEIVIRGHNI